MCNPSNNLKNDQGAMNNLKFVCTAKRALHQMVHQVPDLEIKAEGQR